MGKELQVDDKFRTNPLSHQPGGHEVKVQKRDNSILKYDKIKNPKAYIKKLKFVEEIIAVWVDGVELTAWR